MNRNKPKKNLGASIRGRLKNLSKERNRPFDEILRYYAIERFLYRLSISPYSGKFFLKGGLMLKIWDSMEHRATIDIDLLAKNISNQIENLRLVISEVAAIDCAEDAILFDTQNLTLRDIQIAGNYHGVNVKFSAKLFTAKIPVLLDVGFNDIIIPKPQKIKYPTLLEMEKPILFGYTLETVIAEKLETIVKRALLNTRMKDFYDLWTLLKPYEIKYSKLKPAIEKVFANRETALKYPVAFTSEFFEDKAVKQRWDNLLSSLGKTQVDFKTVIKELSAFFDRFFKTEQIKK